MSDSTNFDPDQPAPKRRREQKSKHGHDPKSVGTIRDVPIGDIRPAPENNQLYQPVRPDDSAIIALAASIRKHGVREPLVVSLDGYILSGHCRHTAARLAGLATVPVRFEPIRRSDDRDRFLVLLREHNRQREKTREERLRDVLLDIDPHEAYRALLAHREEVADVDVETIQLGQRRQRSDISVAKRGFLDAVREVLKDRRKFWPLSDRQIHYALLNAPPLKHDRKPKSRYANDLLSYKSLVDLLTRARLDGSIPMEAIADETRPVVVWEVYQTTGQFIGREMEKFLKRYRRNLLQSQPNHIELVIEKNTVASIVRPVAGRYCMPMTSGRGYCSLPPRAAIAKRFEQSGKDKLVLLVVSDFDPDGEAIAETLARSLRDDFDISNIHPVKVALTAEQVETYSLPPGLQAKKTSSRYQGFADQFGDDVFELEALPPEELQRIVDSAVVAVLDREAFNAELDAEKQDAAYLEGVRRTVKSALQGIDFEGI
ncbi:MAG: ParB N-terminal domain-containing protein [Planctomycetes bacterium]|nr:ParB N-terminal domain-containing protein [Planctomycetota bacterium]